MSVDKFSAIFDGLKQAYGTYKVEKTQSNGKNTGKASIIKEPRTSKLWKGHLSGKGTSVGIIPINEDNCCKWGCIDVDQYPLDHKVLIEKIRALKLPLVVCRSKSGGAHCFLFCKEWVEAKEMQKVLTHLSAALGYGGSEIFPKQEQILVERGDVGNFINLPYFDQDQTMRYAIKEDGEEATFDEFLQMVKDRTCTPDDFVNLTLGKKIDEFNEWPPCMQSLFSDGVPEGTRNTVMFGTCVACKKEQPENWKARLEEINTKHVDPPLPAAEVVTVQQQHDKKEYGFPCQQEPFKSRCNRTLCKTRKYGIGGASASVDVTGLCVVKSEPPVWFCDVDGKRVELITEELQTPQKFQKACMEQIRVMPPMMKMADWQDLVSMMMADMSEIEVPEELTYKGQFLDLVEDYCGGRVQAASIEELSLGKPWTEDGLTFFRIESLIKFLRNAKFDTYSRGQIQERLKEMNPDGRANGVKKFKDSKGQWKTIRVWHVPEFKGQVDVPDVYIEDNEVPF